MPRVSAETIKKLNEFIDSLPNDARNKCALCNETLTHLVKMAEAQTGAGTATVCRVLADKINETAAPADMVDNSKIRDRVRYNEGVLKRENFPNNQQFEPDELDNPEHGEYGPEYGETFLNDDSPCEQIPLIALGEKEIIATANRIKSEKKKIARETKVVETETAKEEVLKNLEISYDIRVCSCKELFTSGIKPDCVITDPPYPKEFLDVFSELAESCKEVPLVAVMSGQTYLPEVMERLCKHLKYRWTLSYLTPGGQAVQQWPVKVNTFWKPVILFGDAVEWFGDVAKSNTNDNDKRFHGWGQSESGMSDLIDRLTKPGQTICDPFIGGGTTAVSAIAMGRKIIGCDIDEKAVKTTIDRLKGMCNVS